MSQHTTRAVSAVPFDPDVVRRAAAGYDCTMDELAKTLNRFEKRLESNARLLQGTDYAATDDRRAHVLDDETWASLRAEIDAEGDLLDAVETAHAVQARRTFAAAGKRPLFADRPKAVVVTADEA